MSAPPKELLPDPLGGLDGPDDQVIAMTIAQSWAHFWWRWAVL